MSSMMMMMLRRDLACPSILGARFALPYRLIQYLALFQVLSRSPFVLVHTCWACATLD